MIVDYQLKDIYEERIRQNLQWGMEAENEVRTMKQVEKMLGELLKRGVLSQGGVSPPTQGDGE